MPLQITHTHLLCGSQSWELGQITWVGISFPSAGVGLLFWGLLTFSLLPPLAIIRPMDLLLAVAPGLMAWLFYHRSRNFRVWIKVGSFKDVILNTRNKQEAEAIRANLEAAINQYKVCRTG